MTTLTEQQIAAVVGAMRAKRRELIAKPLDRIYGELLAAALPVIERALAERFVALVESHCPATQDMSSTWVCEILDGIIADARALAEEVK